MKILNFCTNDVNFGTKLIERIIPHGRKLNKEGIYVPSSISYKRPEKPSAEIPLSDIPSDTYIPQPNPPTSEDKRGVLIEPISGGNFSNVFRI